MIITDVYFNPIFSFGRWSHSLFFGAGAQADLGGQQWHGCSKGHDVHETMGSHGGPAQLVTLVDSWHGIAYGWPLTPLSFQAMTSWSIGNVVKFGSLPHVWSEIIPIWLSLSEHRVLAQIFMVKHQGLAMHWVMNSSELQSWVPSG